MFRKIYPIICCSILFANLLFAQTHFECGTPDKQSWFDILIAQQKSNVQRGGQLITIPYQIHLFQSGSGNTNLTLAEIYSEIDSVNSFYANAGLEFVECMAPQIVNDDYYYDFDYNLHDADVLNQYYTPNVVNMYFANTVTSSNGSALCGYSQFPPSEDYVVMASNCATNGSTLAHELGHLFGLPHTHGGSADELVDGSNCSTEGDYICDTPADPTLSNSIVNSNCVYTGTATDANGMPYVPDPNNIMSYSRKNCRNYFSPMQYDVINYTYINYRNYLNCNFPTANKDKPFKTEGCLIHPNPGRDNVYVSFYDNNVQSSVSFYDCFGRLIYSNNSFSNFMTINSGNWANGVYFYHAITKNGKVYTGKWIKQ